jgi:hypothetical protein
VVGAGGVAVASGGTFTVEVGAGAAAPVVAGPAGAVVPLAAVVGVGAAFVGVLSPQAANNTAARLIKQTRAARRTFNFLINDLPHIL